MQITQNEIVAIVLILAILWIWFTWDKKTEGFTNFTVPAGKKWGDYIYYEDDNEFPVVAPSISHVDDSEYKVPVESITEIESQKIRPHFKQNRINQVGGLIDTSNGTGLGAPFNDVMDFEDGLLSKQNQDDNMSQESVIHELPKSHDHPIAEKNKQILTEKRLMPGMEQKKIMEKELQPEVKQIIMRKPKSKPKKKQKKITEDRYMALAILLSVLLVGFIQYP